MLPIGLRHTNFNTALMERVSLIIPKLLQVTQISLQWFAMKFMPSKLCTCDLILKRGVGVESLCELRHMDVQHQSLSQQTAQTNASPHLVKMVELVLTDTMTTSVNASLVFPERTARQLWLVLILVLLSMELSRPPTTAPEVLSPLLVMLGILFMDLPVELARQENGLDVIQSA